MLKAMAKSVVFSGGPSPKGEEYINKIFCEAAKIISDLVGKD